MNCGSITAIALRLGYKIERGMFRCHFSERHAHGDRTPSVSINEEKGYFKCFVCPEFKGDAVQLVRMTLGLGFKDAVKWLSDEKFVAAKDPFENNNRQSPSVQLPNRQAQTSCQFENIFSTFFSILSPIDPHSPVAYYLAKRHIYKATWDKANLRVIDDYWRVTRELKNRYSVEDLQNAGFFNNQGKMRYGRHPLIIPYIDENHQPKFFQARAIDKNIVPKELNFRGTIPFPFNREVLDGKDGFVYVCEGAIDTLTLLEKGFPAVGIPGALNFKQEWVQLFKNKSVILCFDNDKAGRAGNERVTAMLKADGISVRAFELPEGKDINAWFLG